MDFTFGIITNGKNDVFIQQIIESIKIQNIPNYEIIIVGNTKIVGEYIISINFDETIKLNWITRKKNIIFEKAKYENIVIIHDYIILKSDWYIGFLKYGSEYKYLVTKIENNDGKRFRDYTIFPFGISEHVPNGALIPYGYEPNNNIKKLMYISGAYFIIKKDIAIKYPLDERLCWGQGEDVEYSQRLASNNIFITFNPHSSVKLLKQKDSCHWEYDISKDNLAYLEKLSESDMELLFQKEIDHLKSYLRGFKIIL